MSNKKYFIVVLAVIVFVGLAVVWQKNQSAPPLQKVTLQLKWLHQAQFAGFYAAVKQGYYKQEGLDVSILPVGDDLSAMSVIDRAAKGEIQFGVVGGDQVIAARSIGLPIKAVAVIFQQSPVGIISKQQKGITTLRNLVGKTTGVWRGQDTEIVYHAMMENAGMSISSVKEVDISSGVDQLLSGKIDSQMVYLINEGLEAKERGYSLSTLYPEDYSVRFYGDTLVTSDMLIQQNPDLVQRFVRASLEGWSWAVANPEEAAVLALDYNPKLPVAHEVDMMKESLPFIYTSITSIGGMATSTWEEMERILLKGGIINNTIPSGDIFTSKFL